MALKITKEKKEPRIVEYISPERKELNKRVAEINDKWYTDVTEDDIQFLKDNGLDYDTEIRNVVFADTRKKVDFPYYSKWSWDKENGKVDWIDKAVKAGERDRKSDFGRSIRIGKDNHNYRTSDELKRTAQELDYAKKWGSDRQEKVWQGKHDREKAKLDDRRKDAYNKEWREEQNKDMKLNYNQLRYINRHLKDEDPDDNWSGSYDAKIRRAEKEKAEREAELLARYKDELARYQQRIDDAKATKDQAIEIKNKILRKPAIEVKEDEVEEIENVKESCKVNENADDDFSIPGVCRHCGSEYDIDDCDTDYYWTNNGDRVIYHICPECGESIENIVFDESCDLKERGLTRTERHNRSFDRIWANKVKFDNAEAKFLLANGYSKEDVEELRKHDKLSQEIYDKFGGTEGVKKAHDEFVESCGKKKSRKKITEAPVYDLLPEYDNRKSFYNKARVDVNGRTGDEKLYSYNTLVAEIKNGKPIVYGTYSATTLRHIKEWLKQNGFKADTAKQIMADYGEKFDESAKVCPECGKRKCICNPDDK